MQSFHLNLLWQAAHADNKEAVEFLLQNCADPNHLANGNWKSKEGKPIIEFIHGYVYRANSGHIVKLLREHASKGKPQKILSFFYFNRLFIS